MKQLSAQILFALLSKMRLILRGGGTYFKVLGVRFNDMTKINSFFRLTGSILMPFVYLIFMIGLPLISSGQTTITKTVAASSDDAEEAVAGSGAGAGVMYLVSTDMELGRDDEPLTTGNQYVGLRFAGMSIPAGATITGAYLTFRAIAADAPMTNSEATSLTIRGHKTANPATFTSTAYNISSRPLTTAAANWVPTTWTTGLDYNSPSIVSIIQEIIEQGTWVSGNAISIIITGTGHRASPSYDSDPTNAAKLVVTYTTSYPGGVTGASIWLKANQGVTTGATMIWADQSGNSRNAVQSTAANQPTAPSNVFNFNPSLLFDGVNDIMPIQNLTGLPLGAAQVQEFAVANHLNIGGSWAHILSYGSGTTNQMFSMGKQNATASAGTMLYTNDAISSTTEFTNGAAVLLDGKYTGTQGIISTYGVQRGTITATGNKTTVAGNVGSDPTMASLWNGNISEVIVFPTNLNTTQTRQVNSYLSLKYGITLDQTSAQNYIASDGTTTYWNGTTNSGYKNNIAGIVRDDYSALNQKQSKSVNSGLQVVIGNGNTIAVDNASNTNNFSVDKSALVWGDNGGSVSAWTSTGAPSASQIVARTWKVQETGTVGSVKISVPDNSGTNGLPNEGNNNIYLLVDADGNFNSGATIVGMALNGTNWEANVDFTDGQFFTFASITYAPGGVSTNLSLWLKADRGTSTNTEGAAVDTWTNSAPGGQVCAALSGFRPLYRISNSNYNFNPLLYFGGVDDYFTTPSNFGVAGTSSFSAFAVSRRATDNTVDMLFGGSTSGANSFGFMIHSNDLTVLEAQTIGTKTGANASALAGDGTIKGLVRSASNTWKMYHNGAADGTTGGITGFGGTLTTSNLNVGAGEGTQGYFDGDIAEVIIHSGALSTTEVSKINAYLAIKYGITLDQTSVQNYVNSTGTVIWDASINSTNKNNVTGIGRDDASGLYQKQSKSINTASALVTIGNGNTIAASNMANTNNFATDNSFLIFGDDAAANAWQITEAPIGRQRLSREWKMQEVGTVGSVKVQVPANSSSLTAKLPVAGAVAYLLIDDDGNFSNGTTEIQMTLNGTNWEADVDFNNGQFFTFATTCTFSLTGTQTNVTACFGDATGTITLTASGGTAPYTYDWADIAGTNDAKDRTALSAGTYTVSATDVNNCQAVVSFTITQPTSVNISMAVTDEIPTGANNGAITLTMSGGTSPYTYNWADIPGTNDPMNRSSLTGGTYNLTVTDNRSCTASASATVNSIAFAYKQLYLSDPAQALDRIDPVATADATTGSTPPLSITSAVAIDAISTKSSSDPGSTTFSVSHTTGTGYNRLMLVGISQKDRSVTGVTYGGIPLNLEGGVISSSNARIHLYSLVNPPSGAANVVVTLSSNPDKGIVVGVTTFTGVDQTTPLGTFAGTQAKTAAPSISVASATGELVYDVVAFRNETLSVGSGQTQSWNIATGGEMYGGGSTEPGASSVSMNWTASASQDWAIGAISIKPTPLATNTTFTQNPVLCSPLTIKSGQTITVTNYITVLNGSMPASPNITAVLKYGTTNIITLSNPTYNSGSGLLTWTGTIGSDVIVPAGQAIALQVTSVQAGVVFRIDYDSQTKPSKINLPVTTYIDIPTYAVYSAPFPGGSIITNATGSTTVYPRVTVTDPFGFSDITGLNMTITPPGTTVAATSVATAGCTRTYEYTWVTPATLGTYSIPATAKEGFENTVVNVKPLTFDICTPTIGTPVFSLGATSTRCQAAGTVTYGATSSNATGLTYSLDAASLLAGNTINTTNGAVTFTSTWTGTSTITVTATGCGGPKTATHTVTTTPSVSTPVFALGTSSTRCQGAGSVTYTATASNTTGITYTLDGVSITGGNSIVAATGVVTYAAGWSGTTTITASAAGCSGPKTATHTVTITPSVGTPTFAFGGYSRCALTGTYTATATNTTGITYSLDAASLAAECTINSVTGAVTYPSTWTGTSIITASAAGCNGPTTATKSVSVSGACAPVAINDYALGSGGSPLVVDVLANDFDLNNNINVASLSVQTQATNGTALVSGGQLVYLPNGSFAGTDSFTYRICDNTFTPLCATGKVIVTIDPSIYDACAEATQRHVYYIPFPEQDARTALLASQNVGLTINNIRTIISLKMPYPNMVVTWDHWEDGYETDINNPIQSTSQVWGDGNPFNGIAPGYPNDIIPSGGSIVFDNTIPANPRVSSNIFYDGKDKIVSSGLITVTQAMGEPATIGLQCMKTNVIPSNDFGKSFTIPVGQNYPSQDFAYTALFVRASENNTTINIDKDNNGTFETTTVLNEGQSLFVNGGVLNGAIVTSSAPIGVDVHFGGIDGYSSREIPIFPSSWYSNTYYTPVPTTQSPDTAVVMLYNSLNRAININWTSGAPSSGSIVLPAKTVVRFPLALSATAAYKFVNPTGESFTAIEIVDSYTPPSPPIPVGGNGGSTYDWAFNLISEARLTTFSSVAWAPGSTNGLVNGNPVWVTPAANTTIYVKYNGAVLSSGPLSPCGLNYDVAIPLSALNYVKLFDSDNNQSGLAVFTCDGTKIAMVYGEDPASSGIANPYWDVGSTMQPLCGTKLLFANDDHTLTLTNQPVTISVLNNDIGFLATLDPASINNLGLRQPANGTVTLNANGTILYTPNPGFQGTDVFEYSICSTPSIVCDFATVYVTVNSCPLPNDQNSISGQVFLDRNKDGSNNDTGTGFAGAKVYLYLDGNCNTTAEANELRDSVTVDSSGSYQFIQYPRKIVSDDFDAADGTSTCASGTDGTVAWLTNWVDAGDPSVGFCVTPAQTEANTDVEIFKDGAFTNALRLDDANRSATRQLNTSGASYSFLSFSYRRASATLTSGKNILVQASTNGSAFTTIYTITGDGTTDATYQNVYNLDLKPYVATNTYIRFATNALVAEGDFVFIDDVSITYLKYPQCYITKIAPSSIPANHYVTTVSQRNTTMTAGGTCISSFDFGMTKNSISVSGTLYNDANGLADGLVNGTAFGNPSGTTVYAYLVDSTGKVAFKTTVNAATGVYAFPLADVTTNYTLRLSTADSALYTLAPTAVYLPTRWVSAGEVFGTNNLAGTGVESGAPNSAIAVSTNLANVTGVNMGIQQVNAGPDRATCQFGTVTMAASTTPGTWTADGGNPGTATITTPTSATTTITNFSNAGTYTFLWTNNGISDTALVVVTAKPDAGLDKAICYRANATLTGINPSTGTWTAQAGNPAGATLSSTVGGVATAGFIAAPVGNYNFIYTAAGCTDTSRVTVTSAVAVSGTQVNVDCFGNATGSINITASGGTAPYTYDWGDLAGTNDPEDRTALTIGTYSVTVTDANLCTATTNFTITQPAAIAISTQPSNITECVGGTVALTVAASGGTGSLVYQWESASAVGGPFIPVSGATSSSYTPLSTAAGTTYYRVIITDGNSCVTLTSTTATVVVTEVPSVTISSPETTVCVGAVVTLTATPAGGAGTCSLQWQSSPNGTTWTDISGATNTTYTTTVLSLSTRYRATYTCSASGCCN